MPLSLFSRKRPERASNGFPFSIWFWMFFAICVALFVFGVQEIYEAHAAKKWPRVPCTILKSQVESRGDGDYRPAIEYRYTYENKAYKSYTIAHGGDLWTSDYGDARARAARYPEGLFTNCIVNPKDPTRAFLEADPRSVVIWIAFTPMLIWAIYERVALMDWWRARKSARRKSALPLAEQFPIQRSNYTLILIGVMGALMSGAFITWLLVVPEWRVIQTKSWSAVPCVIIESAVITKSQHQGGNSFEPRVLYSYKIAGTNYTSSKFDLSDDFYTSFSVVKELIDAFPPGSSNICYVNPANAEKSVLKRTFHPDGFFAAFSIVFFGLASFLIAQGLSGRIKGAPVSGLPRVNRNKSSIRFTTRSKPLSETLLAVLGMIVLSLMAFWLGLRCYRSLPNIDFLPLIYFFVIIVGVGWCAREIKKRWLAVFAPSPSIEISPGVLTLGSPFQVRWKFTTSTRRLRLLEFSLAAREEVKVSFRMQTPHGVGEEEKTQKNIVFEVPLHNVGEAGEFSQGGFNATIPSTAMHSFTSPRTRLVWLLRTSENLDNGQSIQHEQEITVLPPNR